MQTTIILPLWRFYLHPLLKIHFRYRNNLNFEANNFHKYILPSVRFSIPPLPALLLALLCCLYGCANIVPPNGGEKDETPPVLVSMTPADSALNARPTRIELRFNKFMTVKELEKNMQLSPILATTPTVTANGRKVTIKIADTVLEDNTTYRIGLGDALTDNRENTPYKNFVYVFSTGAYFDSLEIHGQVFDARTGIADTAMLIGLYSINESDTAVMRKKPKYVSRADASGKFAFQSLPQHSFRIYAIQDVNNNYIYDYGEEKIGFMDYNVTPSLNKDSIYTFFTFKEVRDTTLLNSVLDSAAVDSLAKKDSTLQARRDAKASAFNRRKLGKLSKTNAGYIVKADTSDITKRTQDIRLPLQIDMTTDITTLDTPKLYLSYDNNGIEVEAIQKLQTDTEHIKIQTEWLGDKVYTLRLVKGWAKDSAGNELPPGKYIFRTKGPQDYATLIVHMAAPYRGDSLLLNVFDAKDSLIYNSPVKDSIHTLKLLEPGNYKMQLIIDANKNGKWDPGVLFKKTQPEKVINYTTQIVLKAGWDNEIDFDTEHAMIPGVTAPPKDKADDKEGAPKDKKKEEK